MHKVCIGAVDGRMVKAGGKWLKCIGNKSMAVGDRVWTDGRCVYGHESEGGGSYVPAESLSGIPIFRPWWHDGVNEPYYNYYADGMIQTFGQGEAHEYFINRGNKFTFIDRGFVDADCDDKGNLYTLGHADIFLDHESGGYETSGDPCVRCNGEVAESYNLMPYVLESIPKAEEMAKAECRPERGDDAGSTTEVTSLLCSVLGGRVGTDGSFYIVAHLTVKVEHTEYAYSSESGLYGGMDVYMHGNTAKAELCRRVIFDGSSVVEWFKGYWLNWRTFSYSPYGGGIGDYRNSRDAWYAPMSGIHYPVHDGMYMTIEGTANFLEYPSSSGNYTASIYSDKDELLLELPASPADSLCLCRIGEGKYLVSKNGWLYIWENGNLTDLKMGCSNYRLRRMSNLKKWKKARGNLSGKHT